MFSRSSEPARDWDDDQGMESSFHSQRAGIRHSVLSPIVAGAALIFLVVPLLLPEMGRRDAVIDARAVFDLAADVTSVTISSDARRVAATSRDCPIWMWAEGGQHTWNQMRLPKHPPGGSRCLAVSPDGKTLAAGNVDGTITLWDSESGEPVANLPAGHDMILGLVYSGDGSVLASSGVDSRILVWDVHTHRLQATLSGHHGLITALALSFNGRIVVSGGEDRTVRLWDLKDPEHPVTFPSQGQTVLAVAVSPDGRRVASASMSDSGVRIWDPEERKCRAYLKGDTLSFTCLAFDSDGQSLIGGDETGSICVWNMNRRERIFRFPAHLGWVKCLAVSPEHETLVTGGNDGKVRVWDISERSRIRQPRI